MILPGFIRIKSQLKRYNCWRSLFGAVEPNPARNHKVSGLIPGLAQWIKVLALLQLWHGLQMDLGSGVAVAMV